MNDMTQMLKMALSYTVTTAQGGSCEAENRKAVTEGINRLGTARATVSAS